jgi:NADH-quinone oxidoreductase subunit H
MFYVAEFLHSFTISMIFSVIFLGGWQGPGAAANPLLGFIYLFIKAMVTNFIIIFLRGSLPRFRVDQMMDINWKVLTPAALATVMGTAIVDKALEASPMLLRGGGLLVMNLVFLAITLELLRRAGRQRREREIKSFEPSRSGKEQSI